MESDKKLYKWKAFLTSEITLHSSHQPGTHTQVEGMNETKNMSKPKHTVMPSIKKQILNHKKRRARPNM